MQFEVLQHVSPHLVAGARQQRQASRWASSKADRPSSETTLKYNLARP
jgi:hypothetical protein